MVDVRLEVIKPDKVFSDAISDEVEEEFRIETKVVLKMFKKIVRTWNTKPDFIVKGKRIGFGKDIDLIIGPDITNKAGRKFFWVDQGTKSPRHALMSNPFVPKSRVRKIGSWRGRGGAVFVSRQIRQPGIKARKWTDEIRKRRTGPFQTKIKRAVARGAKRTFV